MRRVVLFSTATTDMSESDLMDMYDFARTNTAEHDVTGLAIYYKKNFCHIREGDTNEISRSIVRTEQSPWHYNLSIVSDGEVANRRFPKWFMAVDLEHAETLTEKPQLLDLLQVLDHPDLSFAMEDLACRSFVEAFLADIVQND